MLTDIRFQDTHCNRNELTAALVQRCRFKMPATTTAAPTTTAANADIIALQEQVAALSEAVSAPTKSFVESEVALAMAQLVEQQAALYVTPPPICHHLSFSARYRQSNAVVH
jgi:hypothetical protein